MSQNFFEKSSKEFNKAIKELDINSLFTSKQFKSPYQATFGSLLIVGAGFGVSIALSFTTTMLSMLLAAVALTLVLNKLTGNKLTGALPWLSGERDLELAVVCLSVAFLTPVIPYVSMLAFAGLALYKSQDLLAPLVQSEQKSFLSTSWGI